MTLAVTVGWKRKKFLRWLLCCIVDAERWVIISMMVMCNGIVIIEHDRRRPGLPNAPVVMEHNNNRTEQ
tara:strand:+ start:124 stop:330 length:207 start_codon:yes stop_codon:yes gene_type:complete